MTERGAVFLAALGDDAARLHPRILAQMREDPPVDRALGVFAVAGSRQGLLALLAMPLVGPRLLVTRFGRDVPFTLTEESRSDDEGRPLLESSREFRFRGSTQRVDDRLVATGRPRELRNSLGAWGRVELVLDCSVTADGALRLESRQVAVRLGRRRVVLRGPLRIEVTVEDGWDDRQARRTIAMRTRSPLTGTVMEYRGWYRLEQEPDASSADAERRAQ